jgi:hypothetical protein
MSGMDVNEAIDRSSARMHEDTDRMARLPIYYRGFVPSKFAKQYDEEEYLLEIYKKLGIEVLGEADYYYFSVKLPEGIAVVYEHDRYHIKKDGETAATYYDLGPFYDRSVKVDKIYVTL